MIVRIQPTFPAGSGRPLTTYVLAVKREEGNRQNEYVPDPNQDKVEWGRTVNLGTDDPVKAIDLIEVYNAQNLRWHSKSRLDHIIISFPEGERPTDEQVKLIEERLMAAIGWGDHPRISALHHDTDNWHHHVAVSRIDPVTLKAEHPSFTRQRFQHEAARLEIELGLTQERKNLLPRQRQEIEIQRKFDGEALKEFIDERQHKQDAARDPEAVWALAKEKNFDAADLRAWLGKHLPNEDERQHVSERVYELRDRDLAADKFPSESRPITVQDIAKRLSPKYAELLTEADEIQRKLRGTGKIEWVIREREGDARLGEYRQAERKAEMSPSRALLHRTGQKLEPHPYRRAKGTLTAIGRVLRDREMTTWENFKGQAEHTLYAYQAHRAALEGRYKVVMRQADTELAKVYDVAERELRPRQQTARAARMLLVEPSAPTLEQHRSPSLRL